MEDIRCFEKNELTLEKISFISIIRNKDYVFENKRGKQVYSFVYAESGSNEFCYNDGMDKIVLKKGEMLFIPKEFPYRATYLMDNTRIKMICFDSEYDLGIGDKPFIKKSVEITNEFSTVTRAQMQDHLYLSSVIYRILYILKRSQETVPERYKKIIPALNEIENNYFENQPISYYAGLSYMSESNFRRLFKEFMGKSVIEYRNEIRLREVNKMLISGEYTVSEAAIAAGFNNMSFFYELYRKYNK